MHEVALGMNYLHDRDIIHLDLKGVSLLPSATTMALISKPVL